MQMRMSEPLQRKITKNYKIKQMRMLEPLQRKTRKQRKTTKLCKSQCQNCSKK